MSGLRPWHSARSFVNLPAMQKSLVRRRNYHVRLFPLVQTPPPGLFP